MADEMGLGKTIQSIGFLSLLYHKYEIYGPFLVVVPLSTVASWQQEFEIWASDLNVVTYVGDVTSREMVITWYFSINRNCRFKAHIVHSISFVLF